MRKKRKEEDKNEKRGERVRETRACARERENDDGNARSTGTTCFTEVTGVDLPMEKATGRRGD